MTDNTIKSARRAFEVLEFFDVARAPLTLKQICERYAYPPSSGAGILKSLVRLGYLEYDKRTRTYLPTMRIAVLGSWVASELFGGMNIINLMRVLRDATRETVILAAESDLYAQYVHVVHSQEALSYSVVAGTLRPLANSGFGRLLLSGQNDAAICATVRRLDAARGALESRIDVGQLLDSVSSIRRQGYAIFHNLITPGVGIIGVLLPQTPFGRVFAIGLGGPSERISARRDENLALLKDAVAQFTAATH